MEISFEDNQVVVLGEADSLESQKWIQHVKEIAENFYALNQFVFLTSGSTGDAKQLSFSRDEIISSAKLTASIFDLKKGSRVLLTLPLQFVAGKMMVYRAIVNQWRLFVLPPTSNPLLNLDVPMDFAALTPHQLGMAFEKCPEKLKLIQTLICGGGRIGKELANQIQYSGMRVFETYGMTETLTHVAVKAIHKGENSFHALPGVTFELDGNKCLVIRCDHIHSSPVITQDIADVISSTEMKWLGRNDFVINSGGVKISPECVEEKLSGVFDFPFYIGSIPDEILGEKVVIFVEVMPTDFPWREMLNASDISKLERPKEMIAIGQFPRTNSGKVIRKRNSL